MESPLPPTDLAILTVYLVLTVVWGSWRPASRSETDYLLGSRNVAWPLLLLSIVATETSTVTFLSLPGQSFVDGGDMTFLQVTFGYVIGRLVVIAWLLPGYFRGEVFTAYEVLERRFGVSTRRAASVLFLLCRTLADGLRLFLTALALQQALGLPLPQSVLVLTVATTIYAALGGVASIVWNDAVQLCVYTTGALVAVWLIVQACPGGASAIAEFGAETGRFRWFDPQLGVFSPKLTFWSGLVGGAFLSLATHGVDQLMVQRYLCARSQRSAALALGLSGLVVSAQFLLFLLIGVGLAAVHAATGFAEGLSGDQAFAAFLVREAPTGLRGVLFAGVIAAAMSTLSSSLNSSASVLVKDLLPRPTGDDEQVVQRRVVASARWATVVFAVLQAGVALFAWGIAVESSVIYLVLAIAGFTTGMLVGLYALATVTGRGRSRVALTGLGVGAAAGVAVFAWNTAAAEGLVEGAAINGMWNALIASAATLVAGLIAAVLVRPSARGASAALVALVAFSAFSATGAAQPTRSPEELGLDAKHLENIEREVEASRADGQFAGCVVAVGRRDGVGWLRAYGDRQVEPERQAMTVDTVFDLASLTKPIATASSVFHLLERGRLRLGDRLSVHLPIEADSEAGRLTIESLLTHHSGYVPDNALEDYRHGAEEAWRRLFALQPETPPGTKFIYSDVNFELLGRIVEQASGRPLDRYAREELYEPLGMSDTSFRPDDERRSRSAATEPRDGAMLVGDVHDPRAALLGGVAGHAGLFSTAADLSRYARMLLGEGELEGTRVLSPPAVREMTRAREVSGARRAAGWDSLSGFSSNRGELMTDRAFGHGGFTGTAFWVDPGLDLFVVFLSNRLHPDGEGTVNALAGRIGSIAAAAVEEPQDAK
ncbi:serine hydrolase [Botrimarina sp.]|uniref:sodium:solute symporter family transporter n=1 Tax=Botrimarina sp. TaxID=2795802 RepID=UPI0032EB13E4